MTVVGKDEKSNKTKKSFKIFSQKKYFSKLYKKKLRFSVFGL